MIGPRAGGPREPGLDEHRPQVGCSRHDRDLDAPAATSKTSATSSSGDGIAKITIDRPEVRNAFRPQTVIELSRAFELAREDPEVGVIILTGEGPQAFCSGGDQNVRGDAGYETEPGVGRRALPRHRPARADAAAAQADRGDGRRLRHRRRPRAARLLRPDDRRRQRALRPDRPAGRARSTAASARSLLAAQIGPEARQGDLVPLPPVRRAAGARHGARQRGRPARAARGGDRRVVPRDARPLPLRAAPAEGELPRRTRTGWPASSSSPTTPTSSSTPARRPRRAARPTRRSARPTSRSSRGAREPRPRIWLMAARPRTLPAGRRAGARRHGAGRSTTATFDGCAVRLRAARRAVHPGRHQPLQRLLRRPARRRHRGPARARCG